MPGSRSPCQAPERARLVTRSGPDEGDTASIPVISSFNFTLPDLTPTPQTVAVAPALRADAAASGALAQSLGEAINAYLLEQEFTCTRAGSVPSS